jgi:hypothetical protein
MGACRVHDDGRLENAPWNAWSFQMIQVLLNKSSTVGLRAHYVQLYSSRPFRRLEASNDRPQAQG